MNDNEIIKALECCVKIENPCKKCPLDGKCISDDDTNILHQYALDIINRQKVEIERLQKTGEEAVNCFTRMETLYKIKCKDLEVAKLEAYREFAELVKLEFYKEFDELIPSIMADKIDNLVKELTEKNDFKE